MQQDLMRDKSKVMPIASNPLAVEKLRIWYCSYKSLAPIVHYKNLKVLIIAKYPHETLEQIACLDKLEKLRILHMPKVRDLKPLVSLQRLKEVYLEVLPSWDASNKRTVVESLSPLVELPELEHLSLFGVVTPSGNLSEIEACKLLKTAAFSGLKKQEIDRFYEVTGVKKEHGSIAS